MMWTRRGVVRSMLATAGSAVVPIPAFARSNLPDPPQSASRIVAFTSDPQFARTCNDPTIGKCNGDPDENGEDKAHSNWRISAQYSAIKNLSFSQNRTVSAMVITKDITEYGHDWQLDFMNRAIRQVEDRMPVWAGLGNHDYANNVDDCAYNGCQINMVRWMVNRLNSTTNPDLIAVDSWDHHSGNTYYMENSLSYCFKVGSTVIFMLQNYPTYQVYSKKYNPRYSENICINIHSSVDWFTAQLKKVRSQGFSVIACFHDFDEHFSGEGREKFLDLCTNNKVSAIITGHYHQRVGIDDCYNSSLKHLFAGSGVSELLLLAGFDWSNQKLWYLPCQTNENADIGTISASNVPCQNFSTDWQSIDLLT